MPLPEPRLETARLRLRVPRRDEFEAWAALGEDPQVMRHLGGVVPRLISWKKLMATIGSWHVLGFAPFSVYRKADDAWIGRIGPLWNDGWPGTEIGWTLARAAWGHGYATEAATAATDWAFANLGWNEVIHCIAVDNHASQAVAARLGSKRRGPGSLPSPYDTEAIEIWGQTRAAWSARCARMTSGHPCHE